MMWMTRLNSSSDSFDAVLLSLLHLFPVSAESHAATALSQIPVSGFNEPLSSSSSQLF